MGKPWLEQAFEDAGKWLEQVGKDIDHFATIAVKDIGHELEKVDIGKALEVASRDVESAVGQAVKDIGAWVEEAGKDIAIAFEAIVKDIDVLIRFIASQIHAAHILQALLQWIVEHPGETALLVANLIILIAPGIVFLPLLGSVGFTGNGPHGIAASIMSDHGMVSAGGLYATLQSAAMGGYGASIISGIVRAVAGGIIAVETGQLAIEAADRSAGTTAIEANHEMMMEMVQVVDEARRAEKEYRDRTDCLDMAIC